MMFKTVPRFVISSNTVPATESSKYGAKESFRRVHSERYIRKNTGHSPTQGGGIFLVGARPPSRPDGAGADLP